LENFGGFGPGKDAHFDQNDLGSPSIPKPMPVTTPKNDSKNIKK